MEFHEFLIVLKKSSIFVNATAQCDGEEKIFSVFCLLRKYLLEREEKVIHRGDNWQFVEKRDIFGLLIICP